MPSFLSGKRTEAEAQVSVWTELGIQPTNDLDAIQHAFAKQVKTRHPEEDPVGFQRLNEAYRTATSYSRRLNAEPEAQTPKTGAQGAIRPWVPAQSESLALAVPADSAWTKSTEPEDDAPLDFAALIAKGVLADMQPPPKHLGRIQKFLTQVSPSLKTWSERYL